MEEPIAPRIDTLDESRYHDYRDLIQKTETLSELLCHPEPGLSSWHEAVQRCRKYIWDYKGKS